MRGLWAARIWLAAGVSVCLIAASFDGGITRPVTVTGQPAALPPVGRLTPVATSASPLPRRPARTARPSATAVADVGRPALGAQLPLGGRTILGRYRVVAFYGGPDGPALGALGDGTPDQVAAQIERMARAFAGYGRPVQPAMELIATVAQRSPGPAGTYSEPIPAADISRYLAAAHRHHMLLILDFQPGRGEFLPQVRADAAFLRDPSVSVALDPEWKMGAGQLPGTVIGSASAASINAVIDYVSGLVRSDHLPDKLLLVHQFTLGMLPDRDRIRPAPGVEVVMHADGFGSQGEKLATWRALAFPGRPFGAGFKLFLRQDTALMTPAEVMALRPQPDVITYE